MLDQLFATQDWLCWMISGQSKVRPRVLRIHSAPPAAAFRFLEFSSSPREKRAFTGIPALQVHRRTCSRWGSDASFGDFSLFCTAEAVDLANCKVGPSAGRPPTTHRRARVGCANSRGLLLRHPVLLEYQNGGSVVLARQARAVDGLPRSAPPSRVQRNARRISRLTYCLPTPLRLAISTIDRPLTRSSNQQVCSRHRSEQRLIGFTRRSRPAVDHESKFNPSLPRSAWVRDV